MRADVRKAHHHEQMRQSLGLRVGEFNELEAVKAHGIFVNVPHGALHRHPVRPDSG
jgi:hypothetical protein